MSSFGDIFSTTGMLIMSFPTCFGTYFFLFTIATTTAGGGFTLCTSFGVDFNTGGDITMFLITVILDKVCEHSLSVLVLLTFSPFFRNFYK